MLQIECVNTYTMNVLNQKQVQNMNLSFISFSCQLLFLLKIFREMVLNFK